MLVGKWQRVRSERHGKPHTYRKWGREEQIVEAGTPGAKHRIVEDPATKEIVVQYYVIADVSRQVPVTEERLVRVSFGPTGTYGKRNVLRDAKPKKEAAK